MRCYNRSSAMANSNLLWSSSWLHSQISSTKFIAYLLKKAYKHYKVVKLLVASFFYFMSLPINEMAFKKNWFMKTSVLLKLYKIKIFVIFD